MSKVLDTNEYIIEPGTDFTDVVDFFDTVHWSTTRMAALEQYIQWANANNQSFILFLKDSELYIKRLKETKEND